MATLISIYTWVMSPAGQATIAIILGALLGISEALSLIPSVKANGIFQLVTGWFKALKDKISPPKAQ